MKKLALSLVLVFAIAIAVPATAQAIMKLEPCEAKKKFDAMPLPPTQPIALVAGHEFRKADVCVPIEIRAKWTNHYTRMDHSFYDMSASEVYPGEFWYRIDREEFVLVANGKNYSGGDKLLSISASGESCHNASDIDKCNSWTAYSNAHVQTIPIFASKTGAFVYTYPTVLTQDQSIPEGVNVMAPPFEFRKSADLHSSPSIVEIDNLDLFDQNPFRYKDLVDAALHKRVVTKQVSWNRNEKKGEATKHKGTLKLQIAFAPVCPKSFRVVLPAADEKMIFSTAKPGTVKIEAEVGELELITPEQEAKITWTAPQKEGSQLAYEPSTKKGKKVTITYKGLPKNNGDFGPTTITATLPGEGSCDEITSSAQVRLFFPRDADNNPDGTEPNWFYYWNQTPARVGPAKYGALAGKCASSPTNARDGVIGYYRYIYRDNVYYICDLRRLPGDFKFTAVQIKTKTPLTIGDITTTGIDTFAIASHHENGHYKHFKEWWFQFNPNPIRPSGDHMMGGYDADGDFIPDPEETARSLDPNDKYTLQQYNSAIKVDDEEYITWLDEGEWVVGSADGKDWAKPGKQWE
jgi:hypothetical protein